MFAPAFLFVNLLLLQMLILSFRTTVHLADGLFSLGSIVYLTCHKTFRFRINSEIGRFLFLVLTADLMSSRGEVTVLLLAVVVVVPV